MSSNVKMDLHGFENYLINRVEKEKYLEQWVSAELLKAPDYAQDLSKVFVNNLESVENNKEFSKEAEYIEDVLSKKALEEPKTEKTTFEVKGFTEKLQDSKNPFARFLYNRIVAFQNRNNKKLNAENRQIAPEDYTDKASAGRFGWSDSELMPKGKGLRNSIIAFAEKILKTKEISEKEPTSTVLPINTFDDRYRVDKDKLNKTLMAQESSKNDKKIIIPENVGKDKEIDDDVR